MLGTSSHQNLSMKKYQTNDLDSSDAREKTRAETSGFAYIVLLSFSVKLFEESCAIIACHVDLYVRSSNDFTGWT